MNKVEDVTALVIVESPAKAKTIEKYLGDGYIVDSSVGHIRDLISPKDVPEDKKEYKIMYRDMNKKIRKIGPPPF